MPKKYAKVTPAAQAPVSMDSEDEQDTEFDGEVDGSNGAVAGKNMGDHEGDEESGVEEGSEAEEGASEEEEEGGAGNVLEEDAEVNPEERKEALKDYKSQITNVLDEKRTETQIKNPQVTKNMERREKKVAVMIEGSLASFQEKAATGILPMASLSHAFDEGEWGQITDVTITSLNNPFPVSMAVTLRDAAVPGSIKLPGVEKEVHAVVDPGPPFLAASDRKGISIYSTNRKMHKMDEIFTGITEADIDLGVTRYEDNNCVFIKEGNPVLKFHSKIAKENPNIAFDIEKAPIKNHVMMPMDAFDIAKSFVLNEMSSSNNCQLSKVKVQISRAYVSEKAKDESVFTDASQFGLSINDADKKEVLDRITGKRGTFTMILKIGYVTKIAPITPTPPATSTVVVGK